MKQTVSTSRQFLKHKLATLVLITASVVAFATLGDGGMKRKVTETPSLLTVKPIYNYKQFSLKSGYNYRGNTLLSFNRPQERYVTLNTVVTYQRGNATYTVPLKKKVLLDKVKFSFK